MRLGLIRTCVYAHHAHTPCSYTPPLPPLLLFPPLPLPSPTCDRTSPAVKPPKELVVRVELDGVETVANVDLEVFERRLELVSQNPVYKLEVGVVAGWVSGVPVVGVVGGWVSVPVVGGCT